MFLIKNCQAYGDFFLTPRYPYRGFKYSPTKKVPIPRHYQNWRMRRDLNPRYGSPRIHDFESRAFSLSATHPLSFYSFTIILFCLHIRMRVRKTPFYHTKQLTSAKNSFYQCCIIILWRRGRDSNSGRVRTLDGFQDRCIKPLCHLSVLKINLPRLLALF